jgi:hypothetical protein
MHIALQTESVSNLADAIADEQLTLTPTAKIFHPEKQFIFYKLHH